MAEKELHWHEPSPRLDFHSVYDAMDEPTGDRFHIMRHLRRSRNIMLYIYRGKRKTYSEMYDHLPSVKFAKEFALRRTRRVARLLDQW